MMEMCIRDSALGIAGAFHAALHIAHVTKRGKQHDFTRTDENLILYTCYPFDALGFTPNRYFCLLYTSRCV